MATEIFKKVLLGVPEDHKCASGSCTEVVTCVSVNCDTPCNDPVKIQINATGQKYETNVIADPCCDEQNEHDYCIPSCNKSECPRCCDPHESLFFHCDICSKADVTTGSRNEGSDPKFACSCTPGFTWKSGGTSGISEIQFQYIETQKKINTVIIDDHNLCEIGATIKVRHGTFPNIQQVEFTTHDGDVVEVESGCDHCGTKQGCKRIVMCFENIDFTTLNIQIATEPGNEIQIGNMFVGRKFEFCLPDDWFNPFFGKSVDTKIDRNRCSQLATNVRKKIRNFQFSDSDVCPDWLEYDFLPFLREIELGEPFYFAWSMHQYPEHVAKLWIDEAEGVQHDPEDGSLSFEFSATGFIT